MYAALAQPGQQSQIGLISSISDQLDQHQLALGGVCDSCTKLCLSRPALHGVVCNYVTMQTCCSDTVLPRIACLARTVTAAVYKSMASHCQL